MKATKYALGAALGLFLIGGATNARADGITTVTQNLEFFTTSGQGGFTDFPAQSFFNIFTIQLFMGSLSSPVFIPGTYSTSDPSNSWVLSPATDFSLNITSTAGGDNFSLTDGKDTMTWFLPSPLIPDCTTDCGTGFVNGEGFVINGVTITEIVPGSVPEPSTLLLLGIGLAGVASARRKSLRRLS